MSEAASTSVQNDEVETYLNNKFAEIKTDFMQSLDQYKEASGNWLYGWALDMEQKIIVNGNEKSADLDDKAIEANMITCPKDGKLTLVHCFESEAFVPIGNTDFTIVAVEKGTVYGYNEIAGTELTGKIDKSGCAQLKLDPKVYGGKKLKITFETAVTQDDVKTLMASYDTTISNLMSWLESEWNSELREEWKDYLVNGIDVGEEVEKFMHNIINELMRAWDDISNLFDLLAHPTKLAHLLSKYIANPEAIAETLEKSKEEAMKMLMLLQDEARCFLCVKAVYCWLHLISPRQILNFISTSLASLLVKVILMIVIPGGAALKAIDKLLEVGSYATALEG